MLAGTASAYPMSSGRLGPASRGPQLPAAQETRQPARAGHQVHGPADDRLLERRPGHVPRAVAAPGVEFDAQPDQVFERVDIHLARHNGRHAAERRGQLQAAIVEVPVRVLIGQLGPDPLVHLSEQRGEFLQAQPGHGGRDEEFVGLVPELLRQLPGPQADQPAHRFGDLFGGQRRHDARMGNDPLGPGGVPDRGALRDPGAVDQPRHHAVVTVVGIPLPGGERGQEPGPGRGGGRVVLLEFAQALGLGHGGELGSVGGGQVTQPRADHVQRLTGICRGHTHLVTSSTRDWSLLAAVLVPDGQASRI
jgi:hypothetical protein